MNDGTLRLVTFSFILSLLFPMFAYTFTTFGDAPEGFDITLSVTQLENAGIKLSEAVTHNVTYLGSAQEFAVKNSTMRVKWVDHVLYGGYFANQQQSFLAKILDTWIFPIEMDVILESSKGWIRSRDLTNATVVLNFDTEYNWTKYTLVQNSQTVFITTLVSDDNNMTKAIYETGIVTVTVGSQVFGLDDGNFVDFGNWYLQTVTGGSSDWGLPAFMVWVVRIFSFMTLLSAMLLIKNFIPFLN